MRPRANWIGIIFTITSSWLLIAIVVWLSPYGNSSEPLIPIYCAAATLAILVVHGIIGTFRQRRHDIARRSGLEPNERGIGRTPSVCDHCGTTDQPIRLVIYDAYIYVVIMTLHRDYAGSLCEACARRVLRPMFCWNAIGCILFPPYIAWAALRRWMILRSYSRVDGEVPAYEKAPH